ncbi:ectonucleotide pyrophosphatase/phosphodiesterase family member 3 [Gadus macrocephalus]|uniref:ectonucleotide pyrophosphatase/phosphodiesterase family member 3 n=1 Tax=Gadus macrocephalus TaxID=80720 RepID=UPI0028CB8409|nr:ectonucleotide pyrophosphatase/phosphodiesterase family member 3 [Gadus macrocephalus]
MAVFTESNRKKKLLAVVLAVSIVSIILGLGLALALKMENSQNEVEHCRGRCYQPYDPLVAGCRCDADCTAADNCCYDYHDVCLLPAEQWECTRLRCGETRMERSRCHCSADCLQAGDCCTNYKHVCQGETAWVEDDCLNLMEPSCPAGFQRPPLLLVSLDGLRADYLQTWEGLLPVLSKLGRCGTSAPFMQAAFPSKTFPNHYTIATGLYPESNGLIDNVMFDPVFNASFSLSNEEKDNPAWYLGQPIWHTARYQGLRSGTFFWPGSDVRVNGSYPDLYRPYDGKVPFEERVFTVLKWLQLPVEERPDFFTLYLEEPDKSGHKFGTVSGQLTESLRGVDDVMGQLMNGLKQLNLHRCLNIIVVADHGMEDTSCERKEVLQDLVDTEDLWVTDGPVGRIRARSAGTVLDAAALVANISCRKPQQKITPYLKPHLPKRFHYANSRRIEDVNVLVTPKWLLERVRGSLTFCSGGAHGYDNDVESMHAMFLSHGPAFQQQTVVQPFSNVELYNLMCDLLQISPSANNGTHGSLNHLLREPFHRPSPPAERSPPSRCPLLTLEPGDTLGCSCPAISGNVIQLNRRLNLTTAEVEATMETHAFLGLPVVLQQGVSYCLLPQQGFVSGYGQDISMPLWSSFSLEAPADLDPLPAVTDSCLRADVRLPPSQSPRCDHDHVAPGSNISYAFLYPPGLNTTADEQFDGLLMSNVVPMFPAFKKIWDYFQGTLLKKYSQQYGGINVVTGPAFDYNYDGRFDSQDQIQEFVPGSSVPVPTHYFAVLTSCSDAAQTPAACSGSLSTVCFLLPHRRDNAESCQSAESESHWVEDLMWFHQSRVRDVEWITGLDFYQGSGRPITELLQLKARPTAAIKRKL